MPKCFYSLDFSSQIVHNMSSISSLIFLTGDGMNKYLKNLRRIEFIITNDCTGKCKHCSQGEHRKSGIHIDKEAACRVICDTIKEYDIHSVMTFGGEPIIYYDITCAILSAATEAKIPHRQLITNGFFSNNEEKIKFVANQLGKSGVNDILLSVDAFHEETIPLSPVMLFASEIKKLGLNIKTSPAWLVNKGHDNEYNRKTADMRFFSIFHKK